MVNPSHIFHVADYVIFAITIAVSLGIGIYYAFSGGRQRTTSEFLVGNRRMTWVPVAISLMVSFESSIMMLGTPAEIYVYGLQWLIGNLGFLFANLAAIKVVVPLIHPLKITSAYEYLELRFKSRAVRTLGTILGMLSYACYMGIVLFGPAIALEAVTGFPQWASIVAVAGASVIYTTIGGLKAVIWTDVFQCFVMFAGFFAVLIKGTMQVGGIGKTWDIAYNKGRVNLFNFDTDPTIRHSFWCLFVGSIMRGFGLIFNQSSIQRISSTPTIASARKVMFFLAPGFFLSLTLAGIEGVVAYAYYDTIGCDPLESKQITNPNQIIPYMVMDIFKGLPGMPGLFMASLFSASLSTLSSGLSSLSALFWADLVQPHVGQISEFKATLIAKGAVVGAGVVAVIIAFLIAMVGGTLIQIAGSILSAFSGPLSGLFMFGAFFPWANAKGAMAGGILSTILTFVIAIGQMTTKGSVKNAKLPPAPTDMCPASNSTLNLVMNMTSLVYDVTGSYTTTEAMAPITYPEPTGFRRLFMLSYQWFGVVGILGVFVIGTIVSLLTGRTKPEDSDPRFLIPFYDELFFFLPESIRKVLRCGVDYTKKKDDLTDDIAKEDVMNMEIVIKSNPPLDVNHTVVEDEKETEKMIKQSIGELRFAHLPVANMEYEILNSSNAVHDQGGKQSNGFIVIDKTGTGRQIQLPVKDIEFNILPDRVDEESAETVSQAENPEDDDVPLPSNTQDGSQETGPERGSESEYDNDEAASPISVQEVDQSTLSADTPEEESGKTTDDSPLSESKPDDDDEEEEHADANEATQLIPPTDQPK